MAKVSEAAIKEARERVELGLRLLEEGTDCSISSAADHFHGAGAVIQLDEAGEDWRDE